MTASNTQCFFGSYVPNVQCHGSSICFIDLVNSNKRCPNSTIPSDLEHFLLLVGHFALPSINLHHLNVCASHYQYLITTRRCNACDLCKPLFGKSKTCARHEQLRPVNKIQAVSIWLRSKLSVYQQWVCATCRQTIGNDFITGKTIEQADIMFRRLYNEYDDIVRTPSSSTESSHDDDDEYRETFDTYSPSEQRSTIADFQQILRSQGFNGRVQSSLSYSTASLKHQRDYRTQTKKIFLHLAKWLAPHAYEEIWHGIVDDENKIKGSEENKNFDIAMQTMVDAYNNARHWSVRRQILGIIAADFPASVIKQYFPNISEWSIKSARHHAYCQGRGTVVDRSRSSTVRYTEEQVEHFIDFILSPHIATDLPFGEKKMRLSTGQIVIAPNTIRNMIPQRIVNQYSSYCAEISFKPLGETVCFEILKACTASTRKCLAGLDTYSANGSSAFDSLIELCDALATYGVPPHEVVHLKTALHQSRNYIKCDFKLHASRYSSIPDHCSTFALSDPFDKDWQEVCDHDHDQRCAQCCILTDALAQLLMLVNKSHTIPAHLRTRLVHRVKLNSDLIREWKRHQMRSVHQDNARSHVLEQLDDQSIFIYIDWAMKFLPLTYREAQRDWFGKRGLSWHIAYVIRLGRSPSSSVSSKERTYEHRTFAHVFNTCPQNGRAIVSILTDLFNRLKQEDPGISKAYLRCDNAGCYHGAQTLLAIEKLQEATNILVCRVDFSEAQAGKGPCDRMAATIKTTVRRYVNERNDCTTSGEFVLAAKSVPHLSIFACEMSSNATVQPKVEWTGIARYNNVLFEREAARLTSSRHTMANGSSDVIVTTWRAFGIGPGKKFRWSKLKTVSSIDHCKVVFGHTDDSWKSDGVIKHPSEKTIITAESEEFDDVASDESNDEDTTMEVDDTSARGSDFVTFNCCTPGCVKQYRRYNNLVKHHARGDHLFKPDKVTLRDRAILMYKDRAESVKPNPIQQLNNFTVINSTSVSSDDDEDDEEHQTQDNNGHNYEQQGWALSEPKAIIRYSSEQIKYLTDKYNEGEASGNKWNPSAVSSEMETKEENGQFVFEPDQFLTSSQVRSFFSRLTAARRQQGNRTQSQVILANQDEDEDAIAEQENAFDSAVTDFNEDSLRSQALQTFRAMQQ